VGAAEDQNLNKICIGKAIKCCYLNLTFSVMSITLHNRYTLC